ncbi:MAG: hypothetical protein KDA25_04905 [Phycisphaerales bacterium]|nr:hypothetical protein [Phycisphaerales bacterium]
MRARSIRLMLLGVLLIVTGGCSSGYTLSGRVVRTDSAYATFVDASDSRLEAPGLAGASVRIYRDPETINRSLAGRATTDADGNFTIVLPQFGVGWMEETWHIVISRSQYGNVETTEPLPSSSSRRRLLVSMRRGTSNPSAGEAEDLYEQAGRYR